MPGLSAFGVTYDDAVAFENVMGFALDPQSDLLVEMDLSAYMGADAVGGLSIDSNVTLPVALDQALDLALDINQALALDAVLDVPQPDTVVEHEAALSLSATMDADIHADANQELGKRADLEGTFVATATLEGIFDIGAALDGTVIEE